MNNTDHDWSLYRSFLAVFHEGSLSAAARSLGTTQPTVGRHIEALERSLDGKRLFIRSQSGFVPTDVAKELLPHAEAMAAAADALVRAASAQAHEIAGTVRISASEIVGAEVLPPILSEFRRKHPLVEIELGLTNQTVDLLRRDADIAVRMVMPQQKALIARKVGKVGMGFYATREYLERNGSLKNLADLDRHALVGFDKALPPKHIIDDLPIKVSRDLFSFRCDSDCGQLAAIRAGLGIGAVQRGIAKRDAKLIPILEDQFGFDMEIWVAMHENQKKVERMRLMFDHLYEHLARYTRDAPESQ